MINTSRLPTSIAAAVIVMLLTKSALAQGYSSQSELWLFLTEPEKIAFMDGFCQGAGGRKESIKGLSEIACAAPRETPKGELFRACGLIYSSNKKRITTWLDGFYRDERFSDVPFWAAVAAFNDRACKESHVTTQLPSLQARGKCFRGLSSTIGSGVSKELREKMFAECSAK